MGVTNPTKLPLDIHPGTVHTPAKQGAKVTPMFFVPGAGPREIELSITVSQLGNLDTRAETCTAKLWVDAHWLATREETTAFESGRTESLSSDFDLADNFQMMNAVTLDKHDVVRGPSLSKSGQVVKWHAVMEVVGTFKQDLPLHQFPLDCQELIIIIEMGNVKDMIYVPSPDKESFFTLELDLCALTGWSVLGAGMVFGASDVKLSKSGNSYARATIAFGLSRNWSLYFWRIILFLFMMQISVLLLWAFDPSDQFFERVELSFLLILTLVSFQAMIHDELPKVNYSTLLEKYTLQGTLGIFIVAIVLSITGFCNRKEYFSGMNLAVSWGTINQTSFNELSDDKKSAENYAVVDSLCFYVAAAALLISHIIFVIVAITQRRKLRALNNCHELGKKAAVVHNLKVGHDQRKAETTQGRIYSSIFVKE